MKLRERQEEIHTKVQNLSPQTRPNESKIC
jgi:hypothetical protein